MDNVTELFAHLKEDWSNDACLGYCIMAMQDAGLSEENISEVVRYLSLSFDDYSLEEAKEKWFRY